MFYLIEFNGEVSDGEMDDDALLAELDGMDEEFKGEPPAKKPANTKPANTITQSEEPEEDIYELESYYHDKGDMCSVTVMEHEIEYLNAKCKKIKSGDPDLDFFKDLVETLEYNKNSRLEDLQERVSPQEYTSDCKKYKKMVEKLRAEATKKLGPKHETTLRL